MKSRLLIVLLIVIVSLVTYHVWVRDIRPDKVTSLEQPTSVSTRRTISFFNVTDYPPALPVMSIIFAGVPKGAFEKIDDLKQVIEKKIHALGPVLERDADYAKLTPIVTEHVQEMITLGASSVRIEFPRQRKGILLFNSKK